MSVNDLSACIFPGKSKYQIARNQFVCLLLVMVAMVVVVVGWGCLLAVAHLYSVFSPPPHMLHLSILGDHNALLCG